VRVAVVAVTEHPREYAAGPGSWEVAWADLQAGCPDGLRAAVAQARRDANLVVVFAHWGPNMATSPERWQQERARELLDAGADLVAGHSAHVFHGVGRVAQGAILYDLGDAVDGYATTHRCTMSSASSPCGTDDEPELELVALRLDFARTGPAEGSDADWIAARLRQGSSQLGTTVQRLDAGRFAVAG
jgi:hypothetical protein